MGKVSVITDPLKNADSSKPHHAQPTFSLILTDFN